MASILIGHTPQVRLVFRLSDGTTIMLYNSAGLHMAASADGVTFGAGIALAGAPSFAALLAVECIADTLYLWWGSGVTWGITKYPLGAGGAPGTAVVIRPPLSATGALNATPVSASYDGTGTWHLLWLASTTTTGSLTRAYLTAFTVGATTATQVAQTLVSSSPTTFYRPTLVARGSSAFVVGRNSGTAKLEAYAFSFAAAAYSNPATAELSRAVSTDLDLNLAIDQNGFLDIILRDGGGLYAIKRSGASSYNEQTLATAGAASIPMTAEDQATGDLFVLYERTSAFATGEIVSVPRIGGTWYPAVVVQGAGATGYRYPNTGRATRSGVVDLLWEQGTGTADTVHYLGYQEAVAPGQPVVLAPSGTVPSPVTFRWQYVNAMIGNPQGAYRLIVTLDADDSVVYDSTWTTASGTTAQPTTTIPTGVGLHVTVQTRDALSSTNSPVSASVAFTVVAAPDPSVVTTTAGGLTLTSGDEVAHPTFTMTIQHAQDDGNGMAAAQLALFPYPLPAPLDGTTTHAVAVGTPQSYSPYVAVGDQRTLALDATGSVVTGHTYALVALDTDAVTGAVGWTTPFLLTVVPAPLDPISGLATTMNPQLGKLTLTWTNPAGTVGNRIRTRLSGMVEWTVLYDGDPITTRDLMVPPFRKFDYEVTAKNSAGEYSQ